MKILVVGAAGRIGRAVAWDLARDAAVTQLGLLGRASDPLEHTRAWLGNSPRLRIHALDVEDPGLIPVLQQYQAAVLTLPNRRSSYRCVEAAIAAGTHAVDVLEEFHRTPDFGEREGLRIPKGLSLREYGEALHQSAEQRGVTVLSGLGFAPGLSNVLLGHALRALDEPQSAVARVGGIPNKQSAARHPLRYMVTWSFEHVLREYSVQVAIKKDGHCVEVEAGSERETFTFDRFGQSETLECAITPGMPSFLHTRPTLAHFAEKTIRWPGHWQAIQTLKDCGLLSLSPVPFLDRAIVPRAFLSALLSPALVPQPADRDVCVLFNTARGLSQGRMLRIEHHLWHECRAESELSAMMQVTGFPAALGARLLCQGSIAQRGIVAPEDGIREELVPWFLQELAARRIFVEESRYMESNQAE